MGDAEYLAVWDHLLPPMATEFEPVLGLILAGLDESIKY
jgi:acetoin utilization deacetylase AcuC-like enzyme